jgi:hypothetical protein
MAKAESARYTSPWPIGSSSRRVTWRRRGALPLPQAIDIAKAAEGVSPRLLKDRTNTMVYPQVLNRGPAGVRSPADSL